MSYMIARLIPRRPNYNCPENDYDVFCMLWLSQILCMIIFGTIFGAIYYVIPDMKNITN